MEVLLTGSSGFVGSHILELLLARGCSLRLLLRPTSSERWLAPCLDQVTVCRGSLGDPSSLAEALLGVSHIIHCAGMTKAYRAADLFRVNEGGVRNLLQAIAAAGAPVERLVFVSSVAAQGPATEASPARETDAPRPVSAYGRSKLAGEQALREQRQVPYVIMRPGAVYGPRDTDFLQLFRSVRAHLRPCFGGGRQPLSLVYVEDLAEAVAVALTHPQALGKCFHVASDEVVTSGRLGEVVAEELHSWTLPLRLPNGVLWPICLLQELLFRITGKPQILTRLKYPELVAPGWVCSVQALREELGYRCSKGLRQGIHDTLDWYRTNEWM
jgi:nucleoside-diphosphate-sugar epimerase